MAWTDLIPGLLFLAVVIVIAVLIAVNENRIRSFLSAVDLDDVRLFVSAVNLYGMRAVKSNVDHKAAGQDPIMWQAEDASLRHLATVALDLAPAFEDSDHAAAVEIWRRPRNPFNPEELIDLMSEARSSGQRWNGRKIDADLETQWAKFCDETYKDSLDDFMTTLHDMRKPKGS